MDRPDILERLKAGDYESVRKAAIAAGITKDPTPRHEGTRPFSPYPPHAPRVSRRRRMPCSAVMEPDDEGEQCDTHDTADEESLHGHGNLPLTESLFS